MRQDRTERFIGDIKRCPIDGVAARVTRRGPKWCEPTTDPEQTQGPPQRQQKSAYAKRARAIARTRIKKAILAKLEEGPCTWLQLKICVRGLPRRHRRRLASTLTSLMAVRYIGYRQSTGRYEITERGRARGVANPSAS